MFLDFSKKNITFDTEFLEILSSLSSGAQSLFIKIIKYFKDNSKYPTCTDLFTVSGMSKNTFYIYYNELLKSSFIYSEKEPSKNTYAIAIQDNMSLSLDMGISNTQEKELSTIELRRKRIKETKQRIYNSLKSEVITPYMEELDKRGLSGLFTEQNKKTLYSKLDHVRSQYKNKLMLADILDILIMALDDPYLQKINRTLSIDLIFFNNPFLIEKFLKEKPKTINGYSIPKDGFFVTDQNKNILDPDQFGYFRRNGVGSSFTHNPPSNPVSLYSQIKTELNNRLYKGLINDEFNIYFEDTVLKKEYAYMIGSSGENNRFVCTK